MSLRDKIVKSSLEQRFGGKQFAFWLLIQEKQIDTLFKYVSELPSSEYYDATGEMLAYYSAFPDVFSESQQEELEKRIITQFLNYSRRADDSGHYKKIASALQTLSKTRPAAAAKAKSVRDDLIRQYPRKSALLSALRCVDL